MGLLEKSMLRNAGLRVLGISEMPTFLQSAVFMPPDHMQRHLKHCEVKSDSSARVVAATRRRMMNGRRDAIVAFLIKRCASEKENEGVLHNSSNHKPTIKIM